MTFPYLESVMTVVLVAKERVGQHWRGVVVKGSRGVNATKQHKWRDNRNITLAFGIRAHVVKTSQRSKQCTQNSNVDALT